MLKAAKAGVCVGITRMPFDAEMQEWCDLTERVADDPDAAPPARWFELSRKYAVQGALIGVREGGPEVMSLDGSWMGTLPHMKTVSA